MVLTTGVLEVVTVLGAISPAGSSSGLATAWSVSPCYLAAMAYLEDDLQHLKWQFLPWPVLLRSRFVPRCNRPSLVIMAWVSRHSI